MKKLLSLGAAAVVLSMPISAHAATHAGDSLLLDTGNGSGYACTLAYTTTTNTGETWGVTAAHCFGDSNITQVRTSDGTVLADQAELSRMKLYSEPTVYDSFQPVLTDVAMFPIKPGVEVDSSSIYSRLENNSIAPLIANTPLVNALNNPLALGEPLMLNQNMVGQFVCKEGSATGRTCGIITGVNVQSGEVYALIPAIEGDSGGPLHLLGGDGKRHIIGTLSGGTPVLYNGFDSPLTYPQP
ncbi:trypsin-like serine protease [Corynebacterium poyangense]|nr:trypsin-like serine protease [Corynebacterium poyangense]